MDSESRRQRIAVIGGGVAGITAAHLLQRRHDVTLFEKNDYVGGHTHTLIVEDELNPRTPVDTGFIVFNQATYPRFQRLLAELGAEKRDTTMSFSYHDEATGFHYSGRGLNGIFSQRSNLFSPTFWRMLADIRRFCRVGTTELERNEIDDLTLGAFLERFRFGDVLRDRYVIPMGAAIWSTSPGEMLEFPARTLLHFWRNHGLLSLGARPRWFTVRGGSHAYVDRFLEHFQGDVRTSAPVQSICREDGTVRVLREGAADETFDAAVVAAHADEARAMLADPDEEEKRLLDPWVYQRNDTVLHTDRSALPPVERAWACWNYARESSTEPIQPVSVTYSMNLLQGLETQKTYCVSLNRRKPVAPASVIARLVYMHPSYTFATVATQPELPTLNGRRNTYFCGSYFTYGFHEDAVRAGEAVGACFGETLE